MANFFDFTVFRSLVFDKIYSVVDEQTTHNTNIFIYKLAPGTTLVE